MLRKECENTIYKNINFDENICCNILDSDSLEDEISNDYSLESDFWDALITVVHYHTLLIIIILYKYFYVKNQNYINKFIYHLYLNKS